MLSSPPPFCACAQSGFVEEIKAFMYVFVIIIRSVGFYAEIFKLMYEYVHDFVMLLMYITCGSN